MGLIRYVRERRRVLIAFGVVCAVFAASFALYHLWRRWDIRRGCA